MSMTRRQATRREFESGRIAPVDMIVDQHGKQIMRRGDCMEVAGEMQVDVYFHRHDWA